MAGGIAHIVMANFLIVNRLKAIGALKKRAGNLLGWLPYFELGAVAPDYPYLGGQGAWADAMHYRKTGEVIRAGAMALRGLAEGEAKDKGLAWLLGYASHVGTDIAVHPVVELKVGTYKGHEAEHRRCEMHQDVWVWKEMKLGCLDDAEYLRNNIATCRDDFYGLEESVENLWRSMLRRTYPELFSAQPPNFDTWHLTYYRMVEAACSMGGKGPFVAFARHMLDVKAVAYPDPDEIDDQYINNLRVPGGGTMGYGEVFAKAVGFNASWWDAIGNALDALDDDAARRALSIIPDANLDMGIPEVPEGADGNDMPYVAWETAIRHLKDLPA